MKTATKADFKTTTSNGALKIRSFRFFIGLVTALVFCFFSLISSAQSDQSGQPAPCRQCFLLKIENSIPRSETNSIDSAFYRNGFTYSKTDAASGTIKLICPKGCSLENVKSVVDELNLKVMNIKEEYTNRSTPKIFE